MKYTSIYEIAGKLEPSKKIKQVTLKMDFNEIRELSWEQAIKEEYFNQYRK
ncbi:hypothetical protein MK079_03345 [Candidatus Gracilibacteria bacterium]|nr:hypothetical protein [Candidatus Gracilibacteria bacterium]